MGPSNSIRSGLGGANESFNISMVAEDEYSVASVMSADELGGVDGGSEAASGAIFSPGDH